jgi:hypothetical protein
VLENYIPQLKTGLSSSSSRQASEPPPQKGIEYIRSEPGYKLQFVGDMSNPFKKEVKKKKQGGKTRKKINTLIRRNPIKTIRKVNKNNKITRKKTKITKRKSIKRKK